ncbi:Vegetative cell wall protein gp1 [Coniochaeta hoffmannii]|uniref:Vegetative cell wall protein gp1 n=1 Tax=Coniochaeta hoffmannii TaxID=91930 RepID=A0AA38S386_9PEZI|nr:Vegetative cell wall protein gp1 [Coniochaeta hoffmannii]
MTYNSPSGSTPRAGGYYYEDKYASPSPTPSPRYYYAGGQTPQRPATRAHFRGNSSGAFDYGSPRTPQFSPRYTSDGQYATANRPSRRERRHSASYYRASDFYGESDEDELIEINGVTYVLPARSRAKRYQEYHINTGGYDTNDRYYKQTAASVRPSSYFDRDPVGYSTPRSGYGPVPERRPSVHKHTRRNSTSVPQRPQTARPTAAYPVKKPPVRKATAEDARLHRIPDGYSLKNWDPSEDPILLLGSVFDANSLGKWIFDWTTYNFKDGSHPMSELAAELWVLLLSLAGKIKRAELTVPKVRSQENREVLEDFIESGERLTDKLRKLLKACEAPMLKSAKKIKDNQLGLNAGVEFVNTMWGRDRELEKTERFMAAVRLWNLRFDANCGEIIEQPGM